MGKLITNAIVFMCLGGIVDFIVGKSFLFSLIGLGIGIVVTLLIKK